MNLRGQRPVHGAVRTAVHYRRRDRPWTSRDRPAPLRRGRQLVLLPARAGLHLERRALDDAPRYHSNR